ncbi:MAG: insulinase family protein [candidate division Zixibacteria bacterium]|nr:insulinase family protein [candidate division Zixibacteria bacterium]
MKRIIAIAAVLLILSGGTGYASMELDVKEYKLDNGMTVLILERPAAPIVSALIRFRVGSVDEVPGITGISHITEHMLFKGTKIMGTSNYEAEKPLMEKIDSLAHEWYEEYARVNNPIMEGDEERLNKLRDEIREVQQEQKKYVIKDELWETYLKHGGRRLNASTGEDGTQYYVSLPANRLELWAFLESDRMRDPVWREFYSERDVVFEERRRSIDTQPWGKLYEALISNAFIAHPYQWPVIGWTSDIATYMREEIDEYHRSHYSPTNAIVSIVGDVKAEEVMKLIHKYFDDIPAQPLPPPVLVEEPEQEGERRVAVNFDAEPRLAIAYHMPAGGHPDQPVLDVISSILSRGRTSRFYNNLEQKGIARSISASSDFGRYPKLFSIWATPQDPYTSDEVEKALYDELEKLKNEPVTDRELQRVRNQLEADFVRGMRSNLGMAWRLANYEAVAGDWNYITILKENRSAVTKDDIMRVAKQYFVPENRTVVVMRKPEAVAETGM